MKRPLAIDLFCGLGGWTDGLLLEGYGVVGVDIEQHTYGDMTYRGELVLRDVKAVHGSWFKDAALIVASPPCQEYSYMAMPWKLAKAKAKAIREDTTGQKLADLTLLFYECFRIQREACLAAGQHVPMVVENVRGAQSWVGKAQGKFGSFYLWGDVPENMIAPAKKENKVPGFRFDGSGRSFQTAATEFTGTKVPSEEGRRTDKGKGARFTSRDCGSESGIKCGGDWFNASQPSISRLTSSRSPARKAASAMIAKIPLPLSRYIAATYRPNSKPVRE